MHLQTWQLSLLIGGILFFVIVFNIYLGLALYVGKAANIDTKKKSDVILVLGAKSYHGNGYNPCMVARVNHAVELYKGKYAPVMLLSGGNDVEDNVNEAETMAKLAEKAGVNKKAILLEKVSTSTYENFLNSKKILQEKHLRSVIIVTEPFHVARAALVAEKLGIKYTVSPAVNSPCWQQGKYLTKYFLKEPVAIVGYKIENKL
jgi:uncharacterized SAM-binding protein YcdF (DUF218 family)